MCQTNYTHIGQHQCPDRCRACHTFNCKPEGLCIGCEKCNTIFYSKACFERHISKSKAKSICEKFKTCPDCQAYLCLKNLKGKHHECGKTNHCKFCLEKVENSWHDCFWPIPKDKNKKRAQQSTF